MASSFSILIYLVVPIVMLVAAIIAHRGKSFWATWMMLIGSILVFVGIAGLVGMMALIFDSMGSGSSRSTSATIAISAAAGIGLLGGFLSFAIGLVGLCARWGPTAKRAAELEELTQSLIEDRSRLQD